jgi:hypothetical protein
MIVCPWCGTSYPLFQSNCQKCGGPLPADLQPLPGGAPAPAADDPPAPPSPPRPISDQYLWRWLLADAVAVTAGIFALVGGIFSCVGAGLTAGIVTAFVGLPFVGLGLIFVGVGGALLYWRYQHARRVLAVLRHGTAASGHITGIQENYAVRVNGRHPWVITYQFHLDGREHLGRVSTLNPPGPYLQPGRAAHILYLPDAPDVNALYPHP